MCSWMCMGEERQRLDSEKGHDLASLLPPLRETTDTSIIGSSSVVSVISLGERQNAKLPSAVLESNVFQRSGAGERPHVPAEGADQPCSLKMPDVTNNPDHVVIEVTRKSKRDDSEYTFFPQSVVREATGDDTAKMITVENTSQSKTARASLKSQNSAMSDSGSVGSIMDWARRTVDRKSTAKSGKKWGPISGPGIKPEAKCHGALKPERDEETDSGCESTSDAPARLPSAKSTVKFRSNNTVVSSTDRGVRSALAPSDESSPKESSPKASSPKADDKPYLKSKLKRQMSRESPSPKNTEGAEIGTKPQANMASKRWAKLSKQRSGIIKMSAGSNLASQAVREALSEIDDQISRCGDMVMSSGNDDDHSHSETLGGVAPRLVKSKSFEHRRLQRQPSNLSAISRRSENSHKSGIQTQPIAELPSVHEMREVWVDPALGQATSTKRAHFSNSVSFLSVASSMTKKQRRCCTIAWWLLRIVTVLFTTGTLLAQVLMRDEEFGEIIVSIFASFATLTSILLAFLSGRSMVVSIPSVLESGTNGVTHGKTDDAELLDSHTPMTQSSAGWLEPSQTVLHQVRATLETAYSALATTEKEMTLWDQLREEQQSLLRSFNKIVTQDVSLVRGKANAFVVIVEETEGLRKQLADVCMEMKYKVEAFPSVDEATSTITDFAPSIASSNNSQKLGVMKNRPGASHRDWRNKDVLNSCKAEQDQEWARVVLLGASQLPEQLPLPEALTDENVFLTLCGTAQELDESTERLLKKTGQSYREIWKAEGVNECIKSPFTKEAIAAVIMEAIHVRFREEFLLLENIGQGTWGNVFRAKRLGDGKVLALKMVNAKRLQQKVRDAMDREVQLLRIVCWPTILFLLDAWVSEQMQCMLLPLCDGGDLLKETTTAAKAHTPISSARVFEWYAQTLHGLAYLHWRGVVHADIKPSNLLLAMDRRSLIVGDFGSAMLLPGVGPHPSRENFVRRPNCTPVYASPESMLQEIHYASSDIWSVGASFFEISTFKCLLPAFLGDAKQLLAALNFEDVSSGGSMNRAKAALAALRDSTSVGDLKPELLEMFCRDPLKRPSAAGLAVRSKTSDRLQTLLVETGAVSSDEKVDHFKDFAKLLIESEEAAALKPPDDCQVDDEKAEDSKDSKRAAPKPFLRRSATQPM